MDKSQLRQIKDRIAALPYLEQCLSNTMIHLQYAKNDMNKLLVSMERELVDVEALKKESFSVTLLKLINKYEGKLEKEEREYFKAKLAYDKAIENVKNLEEERTSLQKRIFILKEEKELYEEEIEKRAYLLRNSLQGDKANKYRDLECERDGCVSELVEVKEALGVAERVIDTLKSVERHLGNAESWATYDIWGGGGIFADMAKYDHIDSAKADFNRLSGQIRELQRELGDIGESFSVQDMGIDSTTRTIDFWFDNIFTDFSVRDKINKDISKVSKLRYEIDGLGRKLRTKKRGLEMRITEIEYEQEQLTLEL